MTSQDYQGFCALADQIDALHRENLPNLFQTSAGPVRDFEYFHDLLAEESVGLFSAHASGTLVGFIHVVIRDTPPMPIVVPRRFAFVDSLVVDPSVRGQGIGKALLNIAQDWAKEQGATSVELNVYEFNQRAISFYQALGYETLSRKLSRTLQETR
jgi:ribosomal protein S18 acetylase RimI-like enzyme